MSIDFSSPMFGALPNHLPFFQYDEDGDAIMADVPLTPPRIVRAATPPPAPARPVRPAGDGDEPVVRNLAEAMAEMVLRDEPAAAAAAVPEAEDWCLSVNIPDLALRLDMRHPRVILNLLRFVNTYNELAPYGEQIHVPRMPRSAVDQILGHISVANPVPEFASEVAELRALVNENAEDADGYSSDSSEESYRRAYYARDMGHYY
jgi:hypothetical protein